MALQKKYYYYFSDKKRTQYKVEIWQETESIVEAEEVRGALNPFRIEYPTASLFEPVKGSGCELNLLSTTDRKFFNLYTADMMEYQIRLYKSGVLIWCGYLDSELYTEPFNQSKNYTVTFTGSDGFALLERLNYLDENGNKYTSISTQFDIIKTIISKLKLNYNGIYISLSTTSGQLAIANNETILHKTFCNGFNWYNEDGDPETCRKVLEEILKPYAAVIIQDNANLYITDINTLAKTDIQTFKKFDNGFNYIGDVNINLNLGDLSAVGFADTGQQMNVISGYNQQLLTYSPYSNSKIINTNFDDEFESEGITYSYLGTNYSWLEKSYNLSKTFEKYNEGKFIKMEGISETNIDDTDSYLKINKYPTYALNSNTLSFKYVAELPYIVPNSDYKIKVSARGFARTLDTLGEDTNTTNDCYFLELHCLVRCGNKKYIHQLNNTNYYVGKGWQSNDTSVHFFNMNFHKKSMVNNVEKYQPIDNQWTDLSVYNKLVDNTLEQDNIYIPLTGFDFQGGLLEFEIYGYRVWGNMGDGFTSSYRISQSDNLTNNIVKDVRLKDIKFELVDKKNNVIASTDTEYISYMNINYKNEGDAITLLQGTNTKSICTERGAMIGLDATTGKYFYLKGWNREGKTDCIENLLLRSVVSNYTNKRVELSAKINQLNTILGCVKYDSFLAGKNLMIVGSTQNFADATTDVTLQEVVKDSLEINKSW